MCEYTFSNGDKCTFEPLDGSKYCILHTDFPEDITSPKFLTLKELKAKKMNEKIITKDFNFEGAKLPELNLEKGIVLNGLINFKRATITGDARFEGATIMGDAWFEGATIMGSVSFEKATIKGRDPFWVGSVSFEGATIGECQV